MQRPFALGTAGWAHPGCSICASLLEFCSLSCWSSTFSFAQRWPVHAPEQTPSKKNLQSLKNLIHIPDHGRDHSTDPGEKFKLWWPFRFQPHYQWARALKNWEKLPVNPLKLLKMTRVIFRENWDFSRLRQRKFEDGACDQNLIQSVMTLIFYFLAKKNS